MEIKTKTYYETSEFGDFPMSKIVEHTYNDDTRIKELEAKNVELEKKLEIAALFIESVPDAHENYGHELKTMCDDALAAIKGASNE